MTFRELARGVEIFDRYTPAEDGVCAMHDELLLGGIPPHKMFTSDAEALQSLGWRWDDRESCWRHFT
jgi:hypothetical protein